MDLKYAIYGRFWRFQKHFERNRSVRSLDPLEKRIVSISTIFGELAVFLISRKIARVHPDFASHIFINFHGAIGENARYMAQRKTILLEISRGMTILHPTFFTHFLTFCQKILRPRFESTIWTGWTYYRILRTSDRFPAKCWTVLLFQTSKKTSYREFLGT